VRIWPLALTGVVVAVLTGSSALAGDSWTPLGTTDGVQVSRKEVSGSDILAFKGTTVTDIPIGQVMAVFLEPKERKHWVDRFAEHETFDIAVDTETYRIRFALPFPISDRDYVLRAVGKRDKEKGVYTVNIKSVNQPSAPANDCCVRAQVYGTYYRFETVDGGKGTRMTVEVHTDPKGLLPVWLVNMIQEDWPSKTLSSLIARAKEKKTMRKDFADWQ
jgi:hypothetical protein